MIAVEKKKCRSWVTPLIKDLTIALHFDIGGDIDLEKICGEGGRNEIVFVLDHQGQHRRLKLRVNDSVYLLTLNQTNFKKSTNTESL